MKLFLQYAQKHWKYLALLIAFACVYALVFSMYDLPTEPVAYALALCIAIGLFVLTSSFLRFRRRHRLLEAIAKCTDTALLPTHADLIELDYQAVVLAFDNERRAANDQRDAMHREMLDYYTLWAHQIKTPIAAMRLLLQSGGEPSELEDELFKIEQYADMVLGYLRTESMSSDLMIRRCDLDAIVKGSVRKFRKQFIRRKLSLNYEPLNTTVLTDEKWLGFVIEQLLTNALKYTPEGSITIAIDEPNVLTIGDTGVGIQPEDLPRIFERGFTGLNGRVDRRATGIGLYLSRRILRRLGHDISIESTPGWGTRVSIHLDSLDLCVE